MLMHEREAGNVKRTDLHSSSEKKTASALAPSEASGKALVEAAEEVAMPTRKQSKKTAFRTRCKAFSKTVWTFLKYGPQDKEHVGMTQWSRFGGAG